MATAIHTPGTSRPISADYGADGARGGGFLAGITSKGAGVVRLMVGSWLLAFALVGVAMAIVESSRPAGAAQAGALDGEATIERTVASRYDLTSDAAADRR